MALESLLAELEPLLYGHNYQVFLRVYRVPFSPGQPAEWYVARALGLGAVVGGAAPVTGPEVVAEVDQSLRYAGDEGSGPEPPALRSRRFEQLVADMRSELERATDGVELLVQFHLQDGHPAYPVFWDFGFVIAGPTGGLVLIGSSSD